MTCGKKDLSVVVDWCRVFDKLRAYTISVHLHHIQNDSTYHAVIAIEQEYTEHTNHSNTRRQLGQTAVRGVPKAPVAICGGTFRLVSCIIVANAVTCASTKLTPDIQYLPNICTKRITRRVSRLMRSPFNDHFMHIFDVTIGQNDSVSIDVHNVS